MSNSVFDLWCNHASSSAEMRPHIPPPPCHWPGPCFFFREGGAICKGGHVSPFEGGGSIDTRTGGH